MEKEPGSPAAIGLQTARRAIIGYFIAIILLTSLALAIVTVRTWIFHLNYPFNSLLFFSGDRFNDFLTHAERMSHFGEPDMLTRTDIKVFFNYSAPTVYVFLFFLRLFPNPLYGYLSVFILAILISAIWFAWSFRDSPLFGWTAAVIALSLVTSYPIWHLLDRANIEGVLWIIMLLGTVALLRGRPIPAAVCFAIAASMKIFPGVLLLLFLARRQYKAFFISIAAAIVVMAVSLQVIGPSIPEALAKFSPAVAFLHDGYVVKYRPAEIGFDHSAFTVLKQILYLKFRSPEIVGGYLKKLEYPYAIVAILTVIAAFWFRLRHLPVVNQLIAYLAFSVLLPFVSNDYTLVHVHLGFAVFLLFIVRDLATARAVVHPWILFSILLSFAVIFTPQSYLLPGSVSGIGGQVKALALISLICLVMIQPLPSSRFGEIQ
jgi:hypothetical protein